MDVLLNMESSELVSTVAVVAFFVLFGLMLFALLRFIDKDAARIGAEERRMIAMQYADGMDFDECNGDR